MAGDPKSGGDEEPIPQAVELIVALGTAETRVAERRRLVEVYRREGFHGAALFFENTIRIAEGKVVDPRPIDSPVAWTTWADAELHRPREVAEESWRLTLDNKHREAIAFARRDMDGHGPSNQVAVQWANAVLWAVATPTEAVTAEEVGVAVRLFLTAIEEYGGAFPAGQLGRP